MAMVFGFAMFSQEGVKFGINAGLPIGQDSKPYLIHLQGNLDYLFHISREIHVGVTTGYSRYLADKNYTPVAEDLVYIPVGGSAQFNISDELRIGGDVGYALLLQPKNADGGIFYSPKIQYRFVPKADLVLAYRGLTVNQASLSSISIGVEFGFFEEY
ncbi:hypothetical protein SAMN03097699_1241 [Flavobacteriaceae bacterium MAR_2010_188]|nr:hypothetical protein SAMN03097699_1241 [Flavobacteriaceae bacterium MAR_2010_188]